MIDFSRPYGLVSGVPGVHYEQDGKGFDNHGREVGSEEDAKVLVIPPAADSGFKRKEIVQALEYLGYKVDGRKSTRMLQNYLIQVTELDN